jgi:diguanylate cyclase (GGDEF)-like protein
MSEMEYDVVITDIVMPGMNGLGVVAAAKRMSYEVDVIVMTGYASMETAVESMKLGARDYITKPFNIDQIRIIVANALQERALRRRAEEGEIYKELSRKDGLTALYNHRFFHQILESELSRAERYDRLVSLLMIDIDDFKRFNDTHGHPAGDVALRLLGQLLQRSCRTCDFVARYGGEEFAVVVPEAGTEAALTMGKRICRLVEQTAFDAEGQKPNTGMTVSVGVATFPTHADCKNDLVERADKALYRAKALGKNRAVAFGDESDVAIH